MALLSPDNDRIIPQHAWLSDLYGTRQSIPNGTVKQEAAQRQLGLSTGVAAVRRWPRLVPHIGIARRQTGSISKDGATIRAA
jgi:hypothetical protein